MVAGIESTKNILFQDKKSESAFVFYFHPAATIRIKTVQSSGRFTVVHGETG